ncbi:hypothetical protein PAXRUDRAFT_134055 [Paxillus rubicundulus Ve08.2h10]|uniref:Unplaced genomic scaffold scaffold_68, whole genome shotgun sequence n=1 Tax=Paxillus rubicundulus Ve08.2h10 TaxID=930991 RepID=A0A0D0EBZ7_9AGAM|nr:hypothetical protein PAXRUDRAFT_134055 [Paxillus rubicundulus Ve08.2h10]
MTPSEPELKKACNGCKKKLALSAFPTAVKGKGKGTPSGTCLSCKTCKSVWKGRQDSKGNQDKDSDNSDCDDITGMTSEDLNLMLLTEFLTFLQVQGDLGPIQPNLNGDKKLFANKVAKLVWDVMNYQWL